MNSQKQKPLFPGEADQKRDLVYEQILLDIICGQLRPGEKVDEASLAQRYGAGRASTRDALFRLALEGQIERRARLGSVITSSSVMDLQQVFQLRMQLEGQCAKLAASNATLAEIESINSAYADADRTIAKRDWRTLVREDRNFHRAVAVAAHNRWMEHVLSTLHNNALRFWHYALPRRPIEALKREIDYHREVAAAIEARDPVKAEAAMREVLDEFPSTVQGVFSGVLEETR